jgi:hypothetical protein
MQGFKVHLKRKHVADTFVPVNSTNNVAASPQTCCSMCQKQFASRYTLKKHQQICPARQDTQTQALNKEQPEDKKSVAEKILILKQHVHNMRKIIRPTAINNPDTRKVLQEYLPFLQKTCQELVTSDPYAAARLVQCQLMIRHLSLQAKERQTPEEQKQMLEF